MGHKVIITGTNGMVGKGVLLQCIDADRVEQILLVNRNPWEFNIQKLKRYCLMMNILDNQYHKIILQNKEINEPANP